MRSVKYDVQNVVGPIMCGQDAGKQLTQWKDW